MTWSIFKDSSRDVKDWECCYAAWYVDYDVDTNHFPNKIKFLHDGYVDVYFGTDYVTCKVEGGEWARDTEQKILGMVSKSYWGEFVEGFAKRQGTIEVIMGS
jgi:hypothetical protein